MALTTPILSPITTFDATKNYDILFNVIGGNQVIKHNIVIYNNTTNVEVYNQTIESFQFKHSLIANTLINGTTYKIQIRTGDINNNYSEFSNWVIFTCYQKADVSITNLTDGIANNQNYLFVGSYISHGDNIKSYLFVLYDENGIQLAVSPLTYSTDIKAEFVLQNQTNYKVELKTYSQTGNVITTGLIPFLASYLAPSMWAELQLTNLESQGAVEIEIIAIDREAEGTNVIWVSNPADEWIDLRGNNAVVRFKEGLNTINNNYSIKMYFRYVPNDKFLQIINPYGYIDISYSNKRFHAYQYSSGLVSHFINSSDIELISTDVVCVEIKYVNGLIDIFAQKCV